jgi:hypothetical protein
MPFQCPICSSPSYARVIVERPDGSPYRTELLHCLGCTMMFLEPALFTAAPELRGTFPPTTMLHEQAARHRHLEFRYWEARAKREGGGISPTSEQVNALRSRLDR